VPYWLETDQFADEQVWEVLAGGDPLRVDQLQALYCRLKAKASHLLTDGYLTEQTALRYARGRRQMLERLTAPVLEQPPKLHREGDKCDCLGDAWIPGYAYRIHQFLRRNPSRAEYNRNRAQRADLRDPRLKAAVYARDGGCCAYCRSGPLSARAVRARDRRKVLTYDHVDPDKPAGLGGENFVTACGRCNDYKGHRTPYEADMERLPEPTTAERAAWAARGPALFDLPAPLSDQNQNQKPINDESTTNQRHDVDPNNDRSLMAIGDPDRDPNDNSTPPMCPANADVSADQAADDEGRVPGRVGARSALLNAPSQPPRDPDSPDIYHRRSRAPTPATPPPDYRWPPGSVPATPPGEHP
jgi:5-methylcytosine-specific restriction endonuclease McrA